MWQRIQSLVMPLACKLLHSRPLVVTWQKHREMELHSGEMLNKWNQCDDLINSNTALQWEPLRPTFCKIQDDYMNNFYRTQVSLGSDLWVYRLYTEKVTVFTLEDSSWWSQLMQVVPSGGQIYNQCKWRHLVAKFGTNASGTIWWPNLPLMQVAPSGGQFCN